MGFADSVKKNADTLTQQVNDKVLETATTMFAEIVSDTPVRSGLLINNWFTGVGQFSIATSSVADKSGSGSFLNIESLLQSDAFKGQDGVVTLSNNLDYSYRANYIGWPRPPEGHWSGLIGPYHWVEPVIAKYSGKVIK